MIFPRCEDKTNKDLSLTIIDIQSKLQRFGAGIHEHWHEQLNEIRYRLEAVDEVKAKICDHYCCRPYEATDEDELAEFCKYCPLNELEEVSKNKYD